METSMCYDKLPEAEGLELLTGEFLITDNLVENEEKMAMLQDVYIRSGEMAETADQSQETKSRKRSKLKRNYDDEEYQPYATRRSGSKRLTSTSDIDDDSGNDTKDFALNCDASSDEEKVLAKISPVTAVTQSAEKRNCGPSFSYDPRLRKNSLGEYNTFR